MTDIEKEYLTNGIKNKALDTAVKIVIHNTITNGSHVDYKQVIEVAKVIEAFLKD